MTVKVYTCRIQNNKKVSGTCLCQKNLVSTDQFREICSNICDYFQDDYGGEKTGPAVSARGRAPRDFLQRWVDSFYAGLLTLKPNKKREPFSYHGSIAEIRKILKVKNPGAIFEDQLKHCAWKFCELILFEIKTLPEKKKYARAQKKMQMALANLKGTSIEADLKEYYDVLQRESAFVQRQRINRPLYCFVSMLAIFYEKWTGKTVTRSNEQFKTFVDYCIEAMGLSKVWPEGSTKKVIERMISTWLSPIRKNISIKYPSVKLGDLSPTEVVPSIYLLDSVSTMPLPDRLTR